MNDNCPYPRLVEDGYEFQVIDQEDEEAQAFLAAALPSDEKRFSVKSGDLVKLVFLYRDGVEKNGQTISAEYMWVNVIECCSDYVRGSLDCFPQFTTLLKADDEVRFHPRHIINYWTDI